YSEHMATVHYENGKYHVHAENIKEAKKSKTGQDEGLLKDVSFFAAHIIEQPSYGFELLPLLQNHFGQLHCSLLAVSTSSITPPPRA
ncbi:MAG TPA: hypothetical protein VL307_18870, partial [Chitinophagaceae bacterium]|nr:hypothetical protein [Chitinophagaceae bacterium]